MEDTIFQRWGAQEIPAGFVINSLNSTNIDVSILFNETLSRGRDLPKLMNIMSNAFFKTVANATSSSTTTSSSTSSAGLTFAGTREFPTPDKINDFDLISLIGPTFYVFILQLLFPVLLGTLVYEKQYKLREIMKMMGLKTEVYWVVTYVLHYLLYMVATMIMVFVGIGLDIRYFSVNSFAAIFLLIFVWGHTMCATAFFLSAFFARYRTATVVGYVYIFATGMLAAQLVRPFLDDPTTPEPLLNTISLFPVFALYRALLILRDSVTYNAPGLSFDQISDPDVKFDVILGMLAMQWVVLMLLAYWREIAFPSVGVRKSPWFCIQKSWWCPEKEKRQNPVQRPLLDDEKGPGGLEESEDVAKERQRTWSPACDDPIRCLDLQKVYPGPTDKMAVANMTMGIGRGECFGLLGPNGSGKSTTINMMCGYFEPTKGTAIMQKKDIRSDVDEIHLMMGMCPQDNILWHELTAYEHAIFYGRLKNLSVRTQISCSSVCIRRRKVQSSTSTCSDARYYILLLGRCSSQRS